MDKQYHSILQWIVSEGIVNEKGEPFDFYDRPWLLDILTDWTPEMVVTACAQVGKSVTFSVKTLFAVKHLGLHIIYTMPTDGDAHEFVATKFNKIIQANKGEFAEMDNDSVERKGMNNRFVYFKGTIGKSAAVSTTADVLIHDELSRSDQNTISTYKSRTKASNYKGRWLFSNPGSERDELDLAWLKSDQKEWIITCPHCNDEHYLSFPESINLETKSYQCRACKKPISDDVRRNGKWVAQNGESKISGYHISHLMCCWISAEEVIEDSLGDPAYFNNFVLGKSYSPGDLSVSKTTILDLWTPRELDFGERFIGIDVGNIKHYIIRSRKGIIKMGRFTKNSELDDILSIWKPKAGVIDAMPDSTLSRYIVEKYPFMKMSYFQENNNNPQTILWWGENDKKGIVYSHRDRIIDQFLSGMIEAQWSIGVPADETFRLYVKHFETLRREKVTNNKGIERYIWESTTGEDHFVFADLYSYIAMHGAGSGVFFGENEENKPVISSDNVYDISEAFINNNTTHESNY